MLTRILVIDDAAKAAIANVVQHASTHKLDLKKMKNPEFKPIGDDPDFCCHLSDGFRTVFSIEQQLDNKWYRHLSVSVNSRTKLPSQSAVEMIMKEFGFAGDVLDCDNVWVESNITPMAINLIQQLK